MAKLNIPTIDYDEIKDRENMILEDSRSEVTKKLLRKEFKERLVKKNYLISYIEDGVTHTALNFFGNYHELEAIKFKLPRRFKKDCSFVNQRTGKFVSCWKTWIRTYRIELS